MTDDLDRGDLRAFLAEHLSSLSEGKKQVVEASA
jgi:hypothetical protein